jgi:hypothetical protein
MINNPTHQTPVQHPAWFCSGTDCNWLEVCLNGRTQHAQTQNHAVQWHRTKLGTVQEAAWEPAFFVPGKLFFSHETNAKLLKN